jgi:type I restriction enzyme S subunit
MRERPSKWQWVNLGSVCLSSQYGINAPSAPNGLYPILGMKNLQDGTIDISDLAYINLSEDELEKYRLVGGDLLINRTNSYDLVGKAALFDLPGTYVFASYLVRFELDTRIADPRFVNYFCNSHLGKNKLQTLATKGVSQANINPTTLKSVSSFRSLLSLNSAPSPQSSAHGTRRSHSPSG